MRQFGNPWIFKEIIENKKYIASPQEILETIIKHFDLLENEKGEHIATLEMRKHISYYVKGMENATQIRRAVNAMESKKEVIEYLSKFH